MKIYKARKGDTKVILEMVAELKRSAYKEMNHPVPEQLLDPTSDEFLHSLYDRPDVHLFLAYEGDQANGFCMAVEVPKISEARNRIDVIELVVHPDFRGKGIGSVLLQHIEKIAKAKNMVVIKVATGTKMRSNEFYKKHGYTHFENLYRKKIMQV